MSGHIDPDTGRTEGSLAPAAISDMWEVMSTARAIRRYTDRPISDETLRTLAQAAGWAPSGSNRQGFRFMFIGATNRPVRELVTNRAQQIWAAKALRDGYVHGVDQRTAKGRLARTMDHYVTHLADVPALVFACGLPTDDPLDRAGASIYPACQNLLLAARALGLGGVMTMFHRGIETELASLLRLPAEAQIYATLTLGYPKGRHGPLRRSGIANVVYQDEWLRSPCWVRPDSEPESSRDARTAMGRDHE